MYFPIIHAEKLLKCRAKVLANNIYCILLYFCVSLKNALFLLCVVRQKGIVSDSVQLGAGDTLPVYLTVIWQREIIKCNVFTYEERNTCLVLFYQECPYILGFKKSFVK